MSSHIRQRSILIVILILALLSYHGDGAGDPMADVLISGGSGHTAITDHNGDYVLNALPGGSYGPTPSKAGYIFHPASTSISVPPNKVNVNFVGVERQVEFIGKIGGTVHAVAVQGNYVYVGMGASLTVFDRSDPTNLAQLGYYDTAEYIVDVQSSGIMLTWRTGSAVYGSSILLIRPRRSR